MSEENGSLTDGQQPAQPSAPTDPRQLASFEAALQALPQEIQARWWKARVIVASRMFAGIDTTSKAFLLMELAAADGIPEVMAFRRYTIIKNKPSLVADAAYAMMVKAGVKVRWHYVGEHPETKKKGAGGWIKADWLDGEVYVDFTEDDAKVAGLTGKDNYRAYPIDMYFARCVARMARRSGSGAMSGMLIDAEAQDLADAVAPALPAATSLKEVRAELVEDVTPALAAPPPPAVEPQPVAPAPKPKGKPAKKADPAPAPKPPVEPEKKLEAGAVGGRLQF
jgi:hypothetical protein